MLPISAGAVFTIGCVISYLVGANTSKRLERLREQDYPALEAIVKIERNVENFRNALQAAAAEGDVGKLKDVEVLASTTLTSVDALGKIDEQKPLAATLNEKTVAYQTSGLRAIRAMLDRAEMGDLLTKMQASMAALDKQIASSKEQAKEAVADAQKQVATGVQRGLFVILGTCLAALAALAAASRIVVSSVWKDLGDEPTELGQAMRRIADGDLSPRAISASDKVHPESISAALCGMTTRLRETINIIRSAAGSITTASSEIATGNHDLSQRTENTAANLQQAASAMEQLTSTVGQTASGAVQARELVGAAANAARRGDDIVSQVVHNMNEINDASRKINEIIGVIDGIAFQTNILALNAAVEAARAGEQGRGFAVVASEVRGLAHRSATAAKEIKSLINVSGAKVKNGTQLVGDAGEAMRQIMSGVDHVIGVITEITDATLEQSHGIGSINRSVSELDQMTQQNSALVEQSTAASASLLEQAHQLAELVAVFRVEPTMAAEMR